METTDALTLSQLSWLPLIWLFILIPPLIWMKQWICRHIQIATFLLVRNHSVMISLYHLVMLPGTVVHELSHWLMAQILLVETNKIDIPLLPKYRKGNQIILGNVQTAKVDPIRSSLIGVAPIFGGCAVILLIARFAFGLLVPLDAIFAKTPTVPHPPELAALLIALRERIATPDLWLWLYLIFAVSNAMLPSSADRHTWGAFLLLGGVAGGVIYLIWGPPQISAQMAALILTISTYLVYAFGLTILVNLIFMGIIAVLELIFGALTRTKFS